MLQPLNINFAHIFCKFMCLVIHIFFDFFLNYLHFLLVFQNIVFKPKPPLIIRFHRFFEKNLLVIFLKVSSSYFDLKLPTQISEYFSSIIEIFLKYLKFFYHMIRQSWNFSFLVREIFMIILYELSRVLLQLF